MRFAHVASVLAAIVSLAGSVAVNPLPAPVKITCKFNRARILKKRKRKSK
jgi:rRNA maturation protein Nop10